MPPRDSGAVAGTTSGIQVAEDDRTGSDEVVVRPGITDLHSNNPLNPANLQREARIQRVGGQQLRRSGVHTGSGAVGD